MQRLIVSVVAFGLGVLGASAQDTDAQKRKAHVPYGRAATDCIAGSVRRDFGFADAVAVNSFREPINRSQSVRNFRVAAQ